MPSDDRIDNKRILVSSPVVVMSRHREGGARDVVPLAARPARARGGRLRCRWPSLLRRLPLGPVGPRDGAGGARPRSACAVTLFPMVHRAAARISLRSRERKLRLFLELFQPGPETTVVDVGVTDAPFGDGSSDNFFEALYPWPERITGVGPHRARPLRGRVPDGDGRARRRARAAVRRRRVRPRLLERGDRARRRRARRASGSSSRELCRVAGSVFVTTPNRCFPLDPHSLLPFVHWLPDGEARRPRAACARLRRRARPARPAGARRALPLPGARSSAAG